MKNFLLLLHVRFLLAKLLDMKLISSLFTKKKENNKNDIFICYFKGFPFISFSNNILFFMLFFISTF